MKITRRTLLQGAGAGLTLGATGIRPALAETKLELGDLEITTLSEGVLNQPADFMFSMMPQAELAAYLATLGLQRDTPLNRPCNITMVRHEDRLIMFDAGSGSTFLDSVGELPASMEAAGVDPGDVTHVVFTHGHADHLWGVLDDFDEPFFYNAKHFFGRDEFNYWIDPDTVNTISGFRVPMAVGAARRLDVMSEFMTFFGDGEEIIPGVAARATYGHSPGHMSFELRTGSESLMIVGDALINGHTAFAHPEWPIGPDSDHEAAAATRLSLLDQISHEHSTLIGFHIPGGGVGQVEKSGDAFRFAPLET